MSVIDSSPFATTFDPPPPLSELAPSNPGGFGQQSGPLPAATDNIRFAPYGPVAAPIETPVFGPAYGASCPAADSWNFGSVMNAIGNAISSLFQQLGSAFGGSGSQAPAPPPGPGQTFFTTASANSSGDPHLSFDGTTPAGAHVDGKWDNMQSHADLLSSNSFPGGYRVSTETSQGNAKGATLNASASVATDGGAKSVSLNANGSYAVTENGAAATLQQGQATSLGNGETVTLNADGSLTVNDSNGQGGSISTTLRSNENGGVDVSNAAVEIDLGGYLVNKSDGAASASGVGTAEPTAALSAEMEQAYALEQQPELVGNPAASQAMVSGLEQYDPESASTSLQNIEIA